MQRKKYLLLLKTGQFFGSTRFPAKIGDKLNRIFSVDHFSTDSRVMSDPLADFVPDAYIFVNHDGVQITEINYPHNRIEGWEYSLIHNWTATETLLSVSVGNMRKPDKKLYQSPQVHEISELMRIYAASRKKVPKNKNS